MEPIPSSTIPSFLVDAYSDPICILIHGKANYLNCGSLSSFFETTINQGKSHFILDLQHCSGLDSTFLGILAATSYKLSSLSPKGSLSLYHVSGRNLDVLDNLGLSSLIPIIQDPPTLQHHPPASLPSTPASPAAILYAHETLFNLSPENRLKFQDVLVYLKKYSPHKSNFIP